MGLQNTGIFYSFFFLKLSTDFITIACVCLKKFSNYFTNFAMEHVTFHLEDEKWDAPHFVDFRKAHEDFNEATSVEDYFFGKLLF